MKKMKLVKRLTWEILGIIFLFLSEVFAWTQMSIRGEMNEWGVDWMEKQLTAQHWHWIWKSTVTGTEGGDYSNYFEFKFDADDLDWQQTDPDEVYGEDGVPGDGTAILSESENITVSLLTLDEPYIFSFDTEGANDMRYEVTRITGLAMCGNGFGLTWTSTDSANKMTQDSTNKAIFTKIINITSLDELQFKFVPNMQWNDPIGESPWAFTHSTNTVLSPSISLAVSYSTKIYITDGANLSVTPSETGKYKFTVDLENRIWYTTDAEPPQKISDLNANGDYGSILLTWTSPGDDGTRNSCSGKFEIRYSSVSSFNWSEMSEKIEISTSISQGILFSKSITGLLPLTSYYFFIKTYDDEQNASDLSNKTTGFVLNSFPSSPYGFSQADLSSNSVSFNQWVSTDILKISFSLSDPDTADRVKFNIVISSFSDFSFEFVSSTSGLLSQGSTSFITPLLSEGSWWWKVKAIDEHDAESIYSSATISSGEKHFGIDLTPPSNVGCLKPADGSFNLTTSTSLTAKIVQDSLSGVLGYEFEIDTTSFFNGTEKQTSGLLYSNVWSTATLLWNTTYFWRLRVRDIAGNVSGWSSIFTFITASTPQAPGNFKGTVISTSSIKWFWDDVINESGYRIVNSTGGIVKNLSENTTFWIEDNLMPNTSYYRKVIAYNVCGSSESASSVKYTLANPPKNFSFAGVFSSSITIQWSSNSNPSYTRWGIFSSTDNFASTTTIKNFNSNYIQTFYTVTGLVSLTSYWFRVCAFNEDGVGTGFIAGSTFTASDTIPPSQITDLFAQPGSSEGEIALYWTSSGNDGTVGQVSDGRWKVDYSTYNKAWDRDDYRIEITTSYKPLTTHYLLLTNLSGGVTYYFRIWAADGASNWSSISNGATSWAQIDVTSPSKITDLSATSSDGAVFLSWTEPGDDGLAGNCQNFEIRYSTTGSIDKTNFARSIEILNTTPQGSGKKVSLTITGLEEGLRYWFAVKAEDERGNFSISNSPSVVVEQDDTAPSQPSNFSAVSENPGEIQLSWASSGDDGTVGTCSGYIIKFATYQITDENFDSVSDSTNTTELNIKLSLAPAVTYYIAIKAYDESGNYSSLVTATVFVSIASATYIAKPIAAPNPATFEEGFVDLYFKTDGEINNATLKIYSLDGDEIFKKTGLYFAKNGWTYYRWDMRDNSGESIPSGIYVFKIKARGFDSGFGRFAVLRTPKDKLRPYLDPTSSDRNRRWP